MAEIESRARVAMEAMEGAGANISRAFPTHELRHVDPFVLLDEFRVSPPSAFPEHPHGGFEIITYLIEGAFRHSDSMGNDSVIGEGGIQKITAGRGISHSEMPGTLGMNRGLQLWIKLPRAHKDMDPSYQAIEGDDLPILHGEGYSCRVIAGEGAPTQLQTPVEYLDLALEAGANYEYSLPEGWNGFVYLYEGELSDPALRRGMLWLLESETRLRAMNDCRLAIVAGKPWNEPIQIRGSFVD